MRCIQKFLLSLFKKNIYLLYSVSKIIREKLPIIYIYIYIYIYNMVLSVTLGFMQSAIMEQSINLLYISLYYPAPSQPMVVKILYRCVYFLMCVFLNMYVCVFWKCMYKCMCVFEYVYIWIEPAASREPTPITITLCVLAMWTYHSSLSF